MNGPLEKELNRSVRGSWMAFVLVLDIGVLIYSQIRVELDSSQLNQHQGSGISSSWSRIIFNLCFTPKIVPLNDEGSNNSSPYSFRTLRLIVGLCTISGSCAIAFILVANFSRMQFLQTQTIVLYIKVTSVS
jgi:hypothetical protein